MADILDTRRHRLSETHRVFDKMWNLLERVRDDEEMRAVTGRDLAPEIDDVLDEARTVRY
jgi:DNA-binding ferritin-like protein (Dps family)